MNLIKIGYAPFAIKPTVIFLDPDTGKEYWIEWLMREWEHRWANVFWHTGIPLKEYRDEQDNTDGGV